MSDFKVTLCNLFRARFPYIAVTTYEENRVIDLIEECAASPKLIKTVRKVFTWSQTEGMLDDKMQPAGTDTRQPLRALEFAHKYKDSAIFIFKDFHLNILCTTRPAEYEVIRKLRDMINDIKNSEAPQEPRVCLALAEPCRGAPKGRHYPGVQPAHAGRDPRAFKRDDKMEFRRREDTEQAYRGR